MAEKMRVHILAKELNVSSKAIIDKCKAEGIDSVKNHMSTLSAGLHATIREWFSEGQHTTTLETAEPIDLSKVRIKKRAGAASDADSDHDDGSVATEVMDAPEFAGAPAADSADEGSEADDVSTEQVEIVQPPVMAKAPAEPRPVEPPLPPSKSAPEAVSPAQKAKPEAPAPPTPGADSEKENAPSKKPIVPAGPQNVPAAAKLQGPRVVRYSAPDYDTPPRRRAAPTVGRTNDFPPQGPPPVGGRGSEKDGGPKRKGRFDTRRAAGRAADSGEQLTEWRDRDLAERRERVAGATGRRIHRRKASGPGSAQPAQPAAAKTNATVHEPIRIKELCAATGLNFIQLFKVLRDEHGMTANVNMIVPAELAQLLTMHFGIELEVVPARTSLDELKDEFTARERKKLEPRPPVVAMLGHVDHGKTSLLDAIRKTSVADAEDGGITQHIGSYHIETARGPVTFLDTPGHEAFAAMRARGAQMTDVIVLVVAADDGVMPQTIEAIRHAQAAKVPIVVAMNKIDLGDQNKLRIFGQLAEQGLNPSEWGGEVDVIPTSTTTGQGIQDLVEHLADLNSLLELRADPTLPGMGTVVEAAMRPGVGPIVRLLVQEGTIHVGDFVVCGNAFGKIRALVDDRGHRVDEVGPGIPVEVWGLDDVPVAGDTLYCVENMQRAKTIASDTKRLRMETGRLSSRKVKTLEEMFKRKGVEELPELNVILKADVDGSLAALRQALGEIPSDEVGLTVRHAAVGAINDSDILLAAACEGIIVAFRVDVSAGARRMAEKHGVDVRPYRVIYDVVDDIRKALSGMLTPEERIEARATAQVRQVFRISKVGAVAGCMVTQGPLERSHLAKVIRDGVVVREGARIASLRHIKDDVREVRSGMECGIRLEGFDDVHAGDVIETYEVIKIARSL